MALDNRSKDRLRLFIRGLMLIVAVFLLLFAVGIPIANNGVALRIEQDLKDIPLPPQTEIIESTSVAGKLIGNGNGMQYFGAVLLRSDLTANELYDHYRPYREGLYDCLIEPQFGNVIRPGGEEFHGVSAPTFRGGGEDGTYYILYTWGSAPAWAKDLLDTDLRGH